jgi:pyrroloquinoline-quinone synthase
VSFDVRGFLADLHGTIDTHPGVNHLFLARCATNPFSREDYKVFGLQHYPLVGLFTTYMEKLLIRGPDSNCKSWIAKVLVDEYGEGSDGDDHAVLYRGYLSSCGVTEGEEDRVPLNAHVVDFVRTHLRLVEEEPFLVGLGALGPGHEWSIPKMFAQVIEGLERAGFTEREISYFKLHVVQDEDHGLWLEEALAELIKTPADAELVRRGTLASLEARARFWDGVQSEVVSWRQPLTRKTPQELLRRRLSRPESRLAAMAQRLGPVPPVYRPQVRALAGLH